MNKAATDIKSLIGTEAQVPPRRSLSVEAADALRELILLEKLAPGTPVPERELAEALGISRTPLKEALRILEQERLVEYSQTRRPRVANPSFDELADNLMILGALEGLAGETACAVASHDEIREIQRREQYIAARSDHISALEFFHLDMAFHRAIVAAARNEPLIETHSQYNSRLWRARFLSSKQADRRDNTQTEHKRIAEALLAREPQATAQALRTHLMSTITNIERVLSQQNASNPES